MPNKTPSVGNVRADEAGARDVTQRSADSRGVGDRCRERRRGSYRRESIDGRRRTRHRGVSDS